MMFTHKYWPNSVPWYSMAPILWTTLLVTGYGCCVADWHGNIFSNQQPGIKRVNVVSWHSEICSKACAIRPYIVWCLDEPSHWMYSDRPI